MERNSLAAQRQQRQVGRRLAESIRYKDSPCTVTSITVDGSSALCGTAVSTIERGDWNQSKLPLVFWCGHLDLACTRDMTHGCLLSLLACPAAQPLSFYATTYLITRVSGPTKALLLSGVEYGRRTANNPSRFQSSTWTRLRGAYKSRVVKDSITGRLQVPCG